jgi:hypothetical protein
LLRCEATRWHVDGETASGLALAFTIANYLARLLDRSVESSGPCDHLIALSTGATVKLTLLGVESNDNGCPTLYATDRDTYVVQGWRVVDPEALNAMEIPGHETAVEIPAALLQHAQAGGGGLM